jgi:hypothetical protein
MGALGTKVPEHETKRTEVRHNDWTGFGMIWMR